MTTLLLKIFLKNNITDPVKIRERYGVLSGSIGIILNSTLAILKFIIGYLTHSVAITADAFNNLIDCITSIFTIVGFKMSAKPADREHPFGHSRIEYLVSLVVAGIILITAWEVLRSALGEILHPTGIYFNLFAIVALVASMLVKFWMFIFNRKLGNNIDSQALIAVAIDSRNDVIITAVTILSLVISYATPISIDGYVGLLLAFIFAKSGFDIAKESLTKLIGHANDEELAEKIKEIVKRQPCVIGMHDLVIHSYGPGNDMASLHVEVPQDMTLIEAHDAVEIASADVFEELGVTLIIHLDPIDIHDERLKELSKLTISILNENFKDLHAYEFRIVPTIPKPTVVFDLQFPRSITRKNAVIIQNEIEQKIIAEKPEFLCNINIEYSYI